MAWFLLGIARTLIILLAMADSKWSIFSPLHVLGWSIIHGASIGQNSLTHTHTSTHYNTHM